MEALLLLGRKIAFLAPNSSAAGSVAGKDVAAVLEKLRIRAIVKVCTLLVGGRACVLTYGVKAGEAAVETGTLGETINSSIVFLCARA